MDFCGGGLCFAASERVVGKAVSSGPVRGWLERNLSDMFLYNHGLMPGGSFIWFLGDNLPEPLGALGLGGVGLIHRN